MPENEFDQAVANFQATHGAAWYLFLSSPLWRAARALASEFSPSKKLPSIATPEDILRFGIVFAANDQGYFDAIRTLEGLSHKTPLTNDPTFHPTYLYDEPATEPRPAPAPEAPPAPVVAPPAPRHRKASPSPKPKK